MQFRRLLQPIDHRSWRVFAQVALGICANTWGSTNATPDVGVHHRAQRLDPGR
jgi:hypothetical protein